MTTPRNGSPGGGLSRRLADGLTVGRAVAGLPLILALAAGWSDLAWWLPATAGAPESGSCR
jgi:CDP-diacylglycerol--glycerol-3-phosphate 3-phosphatidyltransferase